MFTLHINKYFEATKQKQKRRARMRNKIYLFVMLPRKIKMENKKKSFAVFNTLKIYTRDCDASYLELFAKAFFRLCKR